MSDAVCPYCRTPIESEAEVKTCPSCATPHHAECWEENGGCTVFGCPEAPVEEAKIVVGGADLTAHGFGYGPGHGGDTTGVAPPPPTTNGNSGANSPAGPSVSAAPSVLGLSEPFPGDSSLTAVGLPSQTDRRTYILLGFFFGYLGVHNLYANRVKVGIIQLCATVLTCFLASPATWIWALVEVCTVDRDGNHQTMH